jgi:hypothetical protein
MPCQDNYPSDYETRRSREAARREYNLCYVLTFIKNHAPKKLYQDLLTAAKTDPDGKGLRKWWKLHQEMDARRMQERKTARQRKKARAAVLAKLKPKEIALLNIPTDIEE